VLDAVKLADVDEALERDLNNNGHANSIVMPGYAPGLETSNMSCAAYTVFLSCSLQLEL